MIVFLSDREFGGTAIGPGRTELYRIQPDGSGERQLTDNDLVYNIANVTSAHPSARSVLLERIVPYGSDWILDIVSVDTAGVLTQITDNLQSRRATEWPTDPNWSPDGRSILAAVQSLGLFDMEILEYSADGATRQPLLPENTTLDWKPRWSPTGEWVAYLSAEPRQPWQCHVVAGDGTAARRIVEGRCDSMAWSHDGSFVVFSSIQAETGQYALWTAEADGSNPRLLVPSGPGMRNPTLPAVSPDGRHLTFIATSNGGTIDIFISEPDGSAVRPLVASAGNDRDVSFSPDGKFIVFETDRFGPKELMVQSVDGGAPVRITRSGYNRNPIWLAGS
ncbi:MAG: hypothetical protein PVI57_19400 [Gemmatimonadota bacterium]